MELNPQRLKTGSRILAGKDRVLGGIYRRTGPPPFWRRPPGLESLVHIILEQQVSLSSARVAMQRVRNACGGPVTAIRLCELGPGRLRRQARLTRQKSEFILAAAQACQSGQLDLGPATRQTDQQIRASLIKVRGIGPWTADIYLLCALARTDVLPVGDLALASELKRLSRLTEIPTDDWIQQRGQSWKPWRSVAVRMIWHQYLIRLGRTSELEIG